MIIVWVRPGRHSETNEEIPSMTARAIYARSKPFWMGMTLTEDGRRPKTAALSKHFVQRRTIDLSGGYHASKRTNLARRGA